MKHQTIIDGATVAVSISQDNRKMGSIPSLSLPPVCTCAHDAPCVKECYALRMASFRPSIGEAWRGNLDAWKKAPAFVESVILSSALISAYFRYFVGGDIPDADFFLMACRVAKKAKNCHFLMFTKKYSIVNEYIGNGGKIPKNLTVIFSAWGSEWEVPNPYNLPTSAVLWKGDKMPVDGVFCGGNCAECVSRGCGCWALKSGEKVYFKKH